MLPFPVALFSPLLPPFKRYACSHRALTGLTHTYILFINIKECLVSRSTPFNVLFGPSSTTSNGPLYVCICIIICISITLYALACYQTNMRSFPPFVVFFVVESPDSIPFLRGVLGGDDTKPPAGITHTFHTIFCPTQSLYLYDSLRQSPQVLFPPNLPSVVPTTTLGSSNNSSTSFPIALRTKKA